MSVLTLTTAQLKCLASPARNEVFAQLRALGEASVRDLGAAVGKSPETVHYHVKELVAANLAKEAYRRPGTKKPEAVYVPVGKRFRLPYPAPNKRVADLIRKSVVAGFRQTARGYLEAMTRSESESALKPLTHVIRMNARLSPANAKELMDRIEAVVKFADENREEGGIKVAWSSIVYPL